MAVKNYGIHDKWTDLDKLNNVDIKSVDGVIESVKINGEEAGGGSSDFSIATMTVSVIGNTNRIVFSNFLTVEGEQGERYFNINSEFVVLEEDDETVVKIPILDGGYMAEISNLVGSVTITGDGRYFEEDSYIACRGDCTITIS